LQSTTETYVDALIDKTAEQNTSSIADWLNTPVFSPAQGEPRRELRGCRNCGTKADSPGKGDLSERERQRNFAVISESIPSAY
jgi:hypothetical protein